MGYLPIHIYGYNSEHDVIVYTVINDTHSQCGQPRHRFQKSQFWSVYTETLPRALECDQFGHTCDLNSQGCDKKKSEVALVRPAIQKKKKKKVSTTQKVSLLFDNRHVRLISWSKPIRDSEGRTPPLIGRGPDIPVRVCTFEDACAAAVRQRER